MEIQMNIMQEQGERMAGKTLRVLTEGFDRYADCWFGRSYMDSPDVDGKIYFPHGRERSLCRGILLKLRLPTASTET